MRHWDTSIQWGDDARQYVLCHIQHWHSWEQLSAQLDIYFKMIRGKGHAPALVYAFEDDVIMPHPWSLPQLVKFMRRNLASPHQTILLNAPRVLRVFIPMAQQVYSDLASTENDYIFVDDIEQVWHHLP